MEQGNATIERHIANKRATLELADDYPWASWLPKIQYNMNTEVAGGTKKTPYEVVFGQPPRTNIIPDAKAADGIINEEDLPFELNPDSKDNEAQTETQQRIEDDDTEQSNETLPPVSRPTPKPRKRPVPIPMLRPDARTLFPPEDSSTTEVTEQLLIAQADPSDSCDQDNSSKMVDEGTEQLLIAQADPSDSCDQDNSSKMVDEGTEQLLIAQADPSDSCDQDNSSKMVDEGTEQLLIAQADPSDSCDQDNSSKMVDEGTEQLLIAQADPSDSCDQDNSSKMVDEGTEQLLIAQADPSDSCDQDNTSKMVDEDITDSTAKHFKVREEADANYRANEICAIVSRRPLVVNQTALLNVHIFS